MAAAAPPRDAAPEPPTPKQRAWLQHAATPEQLSFFAANGYLPIPQALDPDLLGRVTAVVDEVAEAVWSEKEQAATSAGKDPEPRGEFNYFPCVLDCPATFPLLWDIMGWNIQNYMSVISVKPPEEKPEDEEVNPTSRVNGSSGYHQDGGRPNPEMAWDHAAPELVPGDRQPPMLSLKVAFFPSAMKIGRVGASPPAPALVQALRRGLEPFE